MTWDSTIVSLLVKPVVLMGITVAVATYDATITTLGIGDPTGVVETAEHLSSQSLSVWFVIVVILAGSGNIWVIRLLLKQIEEQRKATSEKDKLFMEAQKEYMDHIRKESQNLTNIVRECTTVLGENVKLLEEILREKHDEAVLQAAATGTAITRMRPKNVIPDPRTPDSSK